MQSLIVVGDRVRFKANKIVQYLIDHSNISLNGVDGRFSQEDVDQLYQLIGYSVDGYDELCGSNVISEGAAKAASHAMCQQFGTTYSRCLDERDCPVHKGAKDAKKDR